MFTMMSKQSTMYNIFILYSKEDSLVIDGLKEKRHTNNSTLLLILEDGRGLIVCLVTSFRYNNMW